MRQKCIIAFLCVSFVRNIYGNFLRLCVRKLEASARDRRTDRQTQCSASCFYWLRRNKRVCEWELGHFGASLFILGRHSLMDIHGGSACRRACRRWRLMQGRAWPVTLVYNINATRTRVSPVSIQTQAIAFEWKPGCTPPYQNGPTQMT